MKKLTAGIFAGILTVVTAGAAHADIATTAYVQGAYQEATKYADEKLQAETENLSGLITGVQGDVDTALGQIDVLEAATDGFSAENKIVDAIAIAKSEAITAAAGDAATKANAAQAAAEATASGALDAYKTTQAATDATQTDDIAKLRTDIDSLSGGAGSVADQIAGALGGEYGGDNTITKAISDAQSAAEAYADGLNTAMDTRMDIAESEIDALQVATEGLDAAKVTQITTNQNAITALTTMVNDNRAATDTAIENITKDGGTIDNKISAAQSTLQDNIDGKMDENTALAGKLLTTDAASGQLKDASAGLEKPAACNVEGNECMLVADGSGNLVWQVLVNTFVAPVPLAAN